MNKSNLRSFAVSARNELMDRVKQKAYELGITEEKVKKAAIESSDAIYINGKALDKREIKQRNNLIGQIEAKGYDLVIEEVAYTWFNRFCALRFMEVNDYLPARTRVLSSIQPGSSEPDIIKEALHLIEELHLDPEVLFELKEQKDNNDLFKYLLVKQCNSLSRILSFLFGKVEDYTEILFPDNLLKEGSFLRAMVDTDNITEVDWQDVEIIGWLYQYYISEKKDQVFAELKKNIKISAENIPAATQLFTPHWIVRYLVENSLGRLWMLNHPDSKLIQQMDYYIEPVDTETDFLRIKSPEEIKICDPACGSGHMLTYAFDLLYAIYEESGYMAREIPTLILTYNLYGIEIDERAGQLAALALTMKARGRNNRFFRKPVQPNICVLQDIHFEKDELKNYADEIGHEVLSTKLFPTLKQFEEASNVGSLIRPGITDVGDTLVKLEALDLSNNMFLQATHQKVLQSLLQVDYLNPKYHVVVANPPYMGSSGANPRLKLFAERNYSDSKSDLFAMFIERNLDLTVKRGMMSMITMQSWMFLSSFENLRNNILERYNIVSMAHLGTRAFDSIGGEVVSTTAFAIIKIYSPEYKGTYLRLVDGRSEAEKDLALKNNSENRYQASAADFKKIPGSPIAYWISRKFSKIFDTTVKPIRNLGIHPATGLQTGDNNRFIRFWFEISLNTRGTKWISLNDGGSLRKWYGNLISVIDWGNDGERIRKHPSSVIRNSQYYLREGGTWTRISSTYFSVRYLPKGCIFDQAGDSFFAEHLDDLYIILGFFNTRICTSIVKVLCPTLNATVGNIELFPYPQRAINQSMKIIPMVIKMIKVSQGDWDSYETSWDFTGLPLLLAEHHDPLLKQTYKSLRTTWNATTLEMQRLEEENNRIFIEAYGLQDELTPDVPLNEITLTCNPYYRYDSNKTDEEMEVLLLTDTIKEYISYAVGCMMGRYSLDEEGLIFAGGDFDPDRYKAFPADKDNVIPVLADDYFKDDIVARFVEFVRITFSAPTLDQNLDFIADALGRKSNETARDTIRRYFVNDFYKDHVRMYKKRPIYWMFTSGKEKAFNCLIYLHRYRPDTVATLRTDYLHRLQDYLEVERKNLQRVVTEEAGSPSARSAARRLPKLDKQIQELNKYDELVHHYADMRIDLDLDDGVKVNFTKLQELLARI